jgi:methyl coenzyme M reductase gamma subunit
MRKNLRKVLSKYKKYIYINSSYIDWFFRDDLNLIAKKVMSKEIFDNLVNDIKGLGIRGGTIRYRANNSILFFNLI